MSELKNPLDFKGKKVLLVPRMEDTNLDKNKNILTTPIYKLSKMAEKFEAKVVAMFLEEEYDVVVSSYSGKEIDDKSSSHNAYLNSGKLYLEFSWDVINAAYWLDRIGLNGKYENVNYKDEKNPNVLHSKKEIMGYKIDGNPIV